MADISLNSLNPFKVGRFIPEVYFCDRDAETATLIKHVMNGRNVALISPRRLGKSGLIEHLFQQPYICQNYYTFYLDIYSTSSLSELVISGVRNCITNSLLLKLLGQSSSSR